jgi:hypothetical protein
MLCDWSKMIALNSMQARGHSTGQTQQMDDQQQGRHENRASSDGICLNNAGLALF